MRTSSLIFQFLALMAAAAVFGNGDTTEEAKKLEGKWVVQTAVKDGDSAKDLEGATFEFDGKTITVKRADPKVPTSSAAYLVLAPRASRKPMRIEFTPQEGPANGKKMSGVFRFQDGILELCQCMAPIEEKGIAPESFLSKRGSGHLLLTFKKKEQ